MDIASYSTRLFDINARRSNRMVEATTNYITEMRAIVTEAETDTTMATNEMLGEDTITSVQETSPQEIARGLFT
jgi:hypothetical protein